MSAWRERVEIAGGRAVLYLGDALEVAPEIPQPQSVVTDPPFGMAFQSNFRTVDYRPIAGDASEALLLWACDLQPSHASYIFCRWDNLRAVPKPRSVVTWVKNNWSMGDLEHEHARQTESVLFYPGCDHCWPAGRPNDVIVAPRTGNIHHPTEKPVGLMGAIVEWTAGTVLDPFMGSGTTGVACMRLGRRFVGIEIDEGYFRTACRRIAEAACQPDLLIPETAA